MLCSRACLAQLPLDVLHAIAGHLSQKERVGASSLPARQHLGFCVLWARSCALRKDSIWHLQASLAQACTAFQPLLLSHDVEVRVEPTHPAQTAILALNSCLCKRSNAIEHLGVLAHYARPLHGIVTWQRSRPPSVVQAQAPAYR
jgi:hypothetical protein